MIYFLVLDSFSVPYYIYFNFYSDYFIRFLILLTKFEILLSSFLAPESSNIILPNLYFLSGAKSLIKLFSWTMLSSMSSWMSIQTGGRNYCSFSSNCLCLKLFLPVMIDSSAAISELAFVLLPMFWSYPRKAFLGLNLSLYGS